VVERAANEREEQWIAKYRAALQGVSQERSRFEGLRKAVWKIYAVGLRYAGKILRPAAEAEKRPLKLPPSLKKRGGNPMPGRTKRKKAS